MGVVIVKLRADKPSLYSICVCVALVVAVAVAKKS